MLFQTERKQFYTRISAGNKVYQNLMTSDLPEVNNSLLSLSNRVRILCIGISRGGQDGSYDKIFYLCFKKRPEAAMAMMTKRTTTTVTKTVVRTVTRGLKKTSTWTKTSTLTMMKSRTIRGLER